MLFAELWMDLQSVIQREVSQKEKNKYCLLTHVGGIQKNGTDEPICKAEIQTQAQRTNVWTPRRERGWDRWGHWGVDKYILLCLKQITIENGLYRTGNSTQCSVVTLLGRKSKEEGSICIHVADPLCCIAETNTTL